MRLTLRDYQVDALDRVQERHAAGVARQLGVAATGLGKTVMFLGLAERMGCRTLVLAHRDELIGQAIDKVRQVWPDAPSVGRVQAGHNGYRAHIVVASVQTLTRAARLDTLLNPSNTLLGQVEPFGLVIVDEAHHVAAESYRRILAAVGAGQPGGAARARGDRHP